MIVIVQAKRHRWSCGISISKPERKVFAVKNRYTGLREPQEHVVDVLDVVWAEENR